MKFRQLETDLKSLAAQWYAFGLQLGMSASTLDAIGGEKDSAANILRRVIQKWLEGSYEPRTKEVLMDAVKSAGNARLAREIKDDKGTHTNLTSTYSSIHRIFLYACRNN